MKQRFSQTSKTERNNDKKYLMEFQMSHIFRVIFPWWANKLQGVDNRHISPISSHCPIIHFICRNAANGCCDTVCAAMTITMQTYLHEKGRKKWNQNQPTIIRRVIIQRHGFFSAVPYHPTCLDFLQAHSTMMTAQLPPLLEAWLFRDTHALTQTHTWTSRTEGRTVSSDLLNEQRVYFEPFRC